MEYEGQKVVDEPSRFKDMAFQLMAVLMMVWLVGMAAGFFVTALATLTPSNWMSWVVARLVLQVGLAVLASLAFLAANGMRFLPAAMFFVLFGALLATNALRALGGPERTRGQVVSYEYRAGGDRVGRSGASANHAVLHLRRADGSDYTLDYSGGAHTGDLDALIKGCTTPGDELELTTLPPLDATLAANCLAHHR